MSEGFKFWKVESKDADVYVFVVARTRQEAIETTRNETLEFYGEDIAELFKNVEAFPFAIPLDEYDEPELWKLCQGVNL